MIEGTKRNIDRISQLKASRTTQEETEQQYTRATSHDGGEAVQFELRQVIKGLEQGLNHGESASEGPLLRSRILQAFRQNKREGHLGVVRGLFIIAAEYFGW